MSSSNTAERFPDFSSPLAKDLIEATKKPQLLLDFSDLHKAPAIIVNQPALPPLPKLDSFSTPLEVKLHIQAVERQIYQLFGATNKDYRKPKEQIDYINQEIIAKEKPWVEDLAERLSIAREIHGTIDNTLADTLEILEFNFMEDDENDNH